MKPICLVVVWSVLAFISTIAAFAQRVEILSAYHGVGNYRIDDVDRRGIHDFQRSAFGTLIEMSG